MAKGKRRVREGVIFAIVFVAIILFALIVSWWKTHAAIGWTIIGVLVVIFVFSLYKSPAFRNWILRKGKKVGEKVALENEQKIETEEKQDNLDTVKTTAHSTIQKKDVVKVFPPLNETERAKLINAVGSMCEKPRCRNEYDLEVHHIKRRAEGGLNKWNNLIVLCPTHHKAADKGRFSKALLKQWISRPRRFKSSS